MEKNRKVDYQVMENPDSQTRRMTRVSIFANTTRVLDVPDHFCLEIQKGIGKSVVDAWKKSNIKPLIKI
jgi:hypothetical protein